MEGPSGTVRPAHRHRQSQYARRIAPCGTKMKTVARLRSTACWIMIPYIFGPSPTRSLSTSLPTAEAPGRLAMRVGTILETMSADILAMRTHIAIRRILRGRAREATALGRSGRQRLRRWIIPRINRFFTERTITLSRDRAPRQRREACAEKRSPRTGIPWRRPA